MPAFSAALAHWVRDHHGIVSSAQLERLDVTPRRRRSLLDHGLFEIVHEGVYRCTTHPITFESSCAAACAADESLVISCTSAGRCWHWRRCASDTAVHALTTRLTVPVGGIVVHRTRDLSPHDVVTRPDGIRVTSPPRTLVDLARHLGDLDLESVIEQALDERRCTMPTLYGIGRRLCVRGRPGGARFARVIGSRPAWRRPADSHPEVVLRAALERAGLRGVVTQPTVRLADGERIHPDLGVPGDRFYIEIDDPTWHGGRVASLYDRGRDRRLRALGACVERVATGEIETRCDDLVRELLASHARWIRDRRLRPSA